MSICIHGKQGKLYLALWLVINHISIIHHGTCLSMNEVLKLWHHVMTSCHVTAVFQVWIWALWKFQLSRKQIGSMFIDFEKNMAIDGYRAKKNTAAYPQSFNGSPQAPKQSAASCIPRPAMQCFLYFSSFFLLISAQTSVETKCLADGLPASQRRTLGPF